MLQHTPRAKNKLWAARAHFTFRRNLYPCHPFHKVSKRWKTTDERECQHRGDKAIINSSRFRVQICTITSSLPKIVISRQ
jgi:hypothetical protein